MLSVCLANEMQPITLQASLAANQMEMGKLRDDDWVWGRALILHFVNVEESQRVHERMRSYTMREPLYFNPSLSCFLVVVILMMNVRVWM